MRFFILKHGKHLLIGVLLITTITFGLMYIYKKPVIKFKEKIVEVEVEKPVYIDRVTGDSYETYWYYTWNCGGTVGYNTAVCPGNLFDYKTQHKYIVEYMKQPKTSYVEITSAIQISKESYDYQQEQEE